MGVLVRNDLVPLIYLRIHNAVVLSSSNTFPLLIKSLSDMGHLNLYLVKSFCVPTSMLCAIIYQADKYVFIVNILKAHNKNGTS